MRKFRNLNILNIGKMSIVFCCSLFILANKTHANFDGFYAGGSLGYVQQNTSINAQQNPTNPNAHINNTQAQRGLPTAEFFLGWGKVFAKSFYGSVEGKIDCVMGGSKKIAEDTNFSYYSKRKGLGFGILARLGYLITPQTMIYGGLGAKLVKFEHMLFEKNDKIGSPFSKQSLSPFIEAGVETFVLGSEKLGVRLSYSFMPGKTLSQSTTSFPNNHIYRDHGSFRTRTSEHALKLGIVCRF